MTKQLIAVVLAGGIGNRFWPLSTDKILFPWFGKPFIEYSVREVLPREVTKVVVVTNPQNDALIRSVRFPVPSVCVVQRSAAGIADAILTAASELADSALLIINGDDVTNSGMLSDVVKTGLSEQAFGVIPGFVSQSYFPGGYMVLDGKNVKNIIEKPGEGNEPGSIVAMLGHYISDGNELISVLKETKSDADDVYEKSLSTLMKRHSFLLHEHTGEFASLKYPWNVLDVTDILLSRLKSYRGHGVDIKSNVIIKGNVHIEDNVKIFENTKIVGPCYIGRGTIIGNSNMIRESHIGANCVTGFSSDISRSYIGDNCWFHNNYIGDSVLEGNISMGGGAALANLRLDDGIIASRVKETPVSTSKNKLGSIVGQHVRIGVNASIMPGIKIGSGTFVGSGVVLDKDVPSGSYCIVKGAYTITRNTKPVSSANRDQFRKLI